MFALSHVTKIFRVCGHEVAALDDVSLEIPRGDFMAIVGPSGSGKSTLLLLLGAMTSPTSGQIFIDGQALDELPLPKRVALRRRKIGFVFQTFHLVPYLTALENVQVPLYLAGLPAKAQQERAAALLEQLGLKDRLEHKPRELSVGQQQRVALARTLANDPDVILADEPTGNLDPDTRTQVIAFLESAHAAGKTVVLVTHDPAIAERCQRVCRLVAGKISADAEAAA